MANERAKSRRRQTDKLLAEWFWTDAWTGSRGFSLPMEPRGLYREMLTQAWRREASLPNDHEEIRRIVGCSEKEWKRCWPKITQFWIVDPGAPTQIVNVTQVAVYLEAKEAAGKASKRGEAGGDASAKAALERRLRVTQVDTPVTTHVAPSVSVSVSEPLSEKNSERGRAHTSGGALAGMLPRDHLRHKVCGRVCLHETQFEQFVRKLGGVELDAAHQIATWARGLLDAWDLPPLLNKPIQGNNFQWWDARWIEWQGSPTASKVNGASKLPDATAFQWTCPHTPHCGNRAACAIVSQRPTA